MTSIHLARDHDHWLSCERPIEAGQFLQDDVEIVRRIATGEIRNVDKVNQQLGALDVTEKLDAKTVPFMCAFDKAGNVSQNESVCACFDHAKIGFQRGERIIRYFRSRGRQTRNEGGFAGVRKSHQADIGKQLQFKTQMKRFTGLTLFMFRRCLMGRGSKTSVAASSATAGGYCKPLARLGKIADLLAAFGIGDDRTNGNGQFD